ncbi:hypothetical protein B566_EDAN003522 [Ephemera danica]|nr:hypothetical protein B566_EDAN003522 [Ephemera danica]
MMRGSQATHSGNTAASVSQPRRSKRQDSTSRQVKMTAASGNRMESQGARLLLDIFLFFVCSVYYVLEALVLTLVPLRYRTDPNRLREQVALVTGGAGGVGRHLCVKLAQRGAIVVIWDLDQTGIDETVRAVQAVGGRAHGYVCDISKRANIYACAEKVKTQVGKVDVVVNNAAITHCRSILDIDDDKIEQSFDINILAHYWIAKAFLPEMIASQRGHIVTVASVAGMMGVYRCTDYSATKFAACGFHEALYTELRNIVAFNLKLDIFYA